MQEEDIQYLGFHINKEFNPKGIVKFYFKKEYGSITIYLSDLTKRPSAASHCYKSNHDSGEYRVENRS
jgi:hypothetical protein